MLKDPEASSMQPVSGGSVERALTVEERTISPCGTTRLRSSAICSSEENHMLNVFVSIQNRLAMLRDDRGQTMAEYGVVLAVVAVIVVVALTALSGGITGALDRVTGVLGG
jgi:pilus assembly protein Flp/PilA